MIKGNLHDYIKPQCEILETGCACVLMGSRFDDGTGSEYIGDDGDIYF